MSRIGIRLAGAASLVAAACWLGARPKGVDADVPGFDGYRLLVWAVDRKAGTVAGFADKVVPAGGKGEVEPVAGRRLTFELGRPKATETLDDDGKRGMEDLVDLKVSHGGGSSAGSKSPASPFMSLEHDGRVPTDVILVGVPLGTYDDRPIRALLARADLRTPAGLEDLVLSLRGDPASSVWASSSAVLQVYRLLGRSARLDRWRERLATGTPAARAEAAMVLGWLGDPAGSAYLCRAVLSAQGNEQVELVDLFRALKPSPEVLKTTVELIVAPRQYVLHYPNRGVGDIDRRSLLLRDLPTVYPKAEIRAHADRLRAYAESLPAGDPGRAYVESLLKDP